MILAGFWTDKGSCSEKMAEFLKSLNHKKVYLFGTAGFGGQVEYFHRLLSNVKENLNVSNQVIGEFMCQGKMPASVRMRFAAMLEKAPEDEHVKGMMENFDKALSHPDSDNVEALKTSVERSLKSVR